MTASTRPIRSDSAWLLLKPGTRQKMRGVMLLYPDKLAAALTRLGREVRATTGGLTITPHPAGD